MVVGIHPAAPPVRSQKLGCAIGQHLVDVHVMGGAGAGLKRVHHKLAVVPPHQSLIGRGHDGVPDLTVKPPRSHVSQSRALLDEERGPDKDRKRLQPRDGKVSHGPGCLGSVEGIDGNFHGSQCVVFDSHRHDTPPSPFTV